MDINSRNSTIRAGKSLNIHNKTFYETFALTFKSHQSNAQKRQEYAALKDKINKIID